MIDKVSIVVLLMTFVSAIALPHSASGFQETGEAPAVDQSDLLAALAITPRAFRVAAAKVQPSLVTIESFGGVSTKAGEIGGIRRQGEGNTTGVVISSDGLVVTSSFNFIQQPRTITVITSDGQRRVANLMGRDDTRRICILKIADVEGLDVPEMVSPSDVQVGQWAISVGVGYGDENPAISMGIISAKGRMAGRAIQTDANISPANYGGPLVDIEGRLIGICVPMSPGSQNLASGVEWYDSGIGFAIPLHGQEKLLDRLADGDHIQRAFMGIRSEDAGSKDGIKITEVLPGTGAEKAGLKKDDIIKKVDGHEIPDIAELRTILARFVAGEEIPVIYVRDDKEQEIQVTLGSPPNDEAEDTPSLFPGRRRQNEPDR